MVGRSTENAPPMHPHCRCSTSAYEDSEEYEAWLDFLDKGGTTVEWNKFGKAEWQKSITAKPLENSGGSSKMMYRTKENTGAFEVLPERMSRKHIKRVAKDFGINLKGVSIIIEADDNLLGKGLCGAANANKIGEITFFPDAFQTREELLRTIFHEKTHIEQYKEYGGEYVRDNQAYFDDLAFKAEDEFIDSLKKKGLL